jgi:hypothetical protein
VLKQLLATVAAGRAGNTAELASALQVSPGLAEAMVGDLARRGLLERVGDCGTPCAGCPAEMDCGPAPRRGAWMLTEAGRRCAES